MDRDAAEINRRPRSRWSQGADAFHAEPAYGGRTDRPASPIDPPATASEASGADGTPATPTSRARRPKTKKRADPGGTRASLKPG